MRIDAVPTESKTTYHIGGVSYDPDDPLGKKANAKRAKAAKKSNRLHKAKPKLKPKRRESADRLTVAAILTKDQADRLERWCELQAELWHTLVQHNERVSHETGTYLSGNKMSSYLTSLKKQHPRFSELPAESAQNVAQGVVDAFVRFVVTGLKDEGILYAKKRHWSLHFNYARLVNRMEPGNQSTLQLSKLGLVEFHSTNKRLMTFLRQPDVHIKGVHMWRSTKDEPWRISISYGLTDGAKKAPRSPDKLAVLRAVVCAFAARGADMLSTTVILSELAKRGIELHARQLAAHMRQFGLPGPQGIWVSGKHLSGYRRVDVMSIINDRKADGARGRS